MTRSDTRTSCSLTGARSITPRPKALELCCWPTQPNLISRPIRAQRLGADGQQQREHRLQFAYGAGDGSADAAPLGVYDPGTLPTQTRPSRGNEGTTQETGARIAGLGAECETDRTGAAKLPMDLCG